MKQNRLPITFVRAPIVSKIGSVNNEATPAIGFAYLSGYLKKFGYEPVFVDAIKKMTIKDAISIVKGDSTAGTDYLNKNTNTALVEAFRPIIKSSLKKVNATKYWKDIMGVYNKIPSVKKMNPDLESYVTGEAIEGLFFMIAEEEIEIRKNPQKRITELLKKVFGS